MSDIGPSDEDKLRAFIEQLTGGRVVALTRQPRWRPAWFVDVEKDGAILRLHARGDRQSDIVPFPELRREGDVMAVLGELGVPVPHIYGFCEDPQAIVMESIAGERDMAPVTDAQMRSIRRQYVEAVVKMHKSPVAPFAARGIEVPQGAEAIQLAGLNAYMPLYHKVKKKPEPLIEFALGWIRRNVPVHRDRPSFVQYDSGQFLHDSGRMTGLYDFEFAMICDPMVDLATMRMRDSYEPLGGDLRDLFREYETVSGELIDDKVLTFHNVIFATMSIAQISGAVPAPKPGDPHAVYLEWDLALRRVLVKVLAEAIGTEIDPPAPLTEAPRRVPPKIVMLQDAVQQFGPTDDIQRMQQDAADRVAEYVARGYAYGEEADRQSRAEAAEILGADHGDWDAIDAALERFVQAAGPEEDDRLLRFFHRQVERDVLVYGPTRIGHSARNVYLPPLR